VKLAIEPVAVRLRTPFVSATGATEVRELLLVRIEDAEGWVGLGEAAPLESYDGVSLEDCRAALEDCRRVLARSDGSNQPELLRQCAEAAVLPQAVAAVDLALWDLAGRRDGEPAWRLLGAGASRVVEVNQTIAAPDRAGAVAAALQAREAGYRVVKVKVGIGDDAGRLAALRAAAGPDMGIRLDANGAWSVPEARQALEALRPAGIELCEEPVHGLHALADVARQTEVELAMDESAALPGALDHRVCTSVCLKISRCGGITGTIDAARRARAAGYDVYLASTLDGPLGIAGALHAAAVIAPDRACGLATLSQFEVRPAHLVPQQGRLSPPAGSGLGDGLEHWYGARTRRR
jgi:L-alanine-DL-glutamate epimerase-like enolase superfamily enzyme